jgi:hypothetical protein
VKTLDIPGAYLKAALPPVDFPIHVKLGQVEAAILCQLHPEYCAYLQEDGTMITAGRHLAAQVH